MNCFLIRMALVAGVLCLFLTNATQGLEIRPQHTCRIPLNFDGYGGNYYVGADDGAGWKVYVCLRYGSLTTNTSQGPSPTIMALECVVNDKRTGQLLYRPEGEEACRQGIENGESCNVLIGKRPEVPTEQTGPGSTPNQVYVTLGAHLCTENFSRSSVPEASVGKCARGKLVQPELELDGLTISPNTQFDCKSIQQTLMYGMA